MNNRPIELSFLTGHTLQLGLFERGINGTPRYNRGISSHALVIDISVTLIDERYYRKDVFELKRTRMVNELENHLHGAVLVDDGDVFLRNLLTPSGLSTLTTLLHGGPYGGVPVLASRDVTPPITRLDFPFFIGKDAEELETNLFRYLGSWIKDRINAMMAETVAGNLQLVTDCTVKMQFNGKSFTMN